jgi:adenosylcobinamide kinase/adenosylcobinamide-phosphate guanylyltransferase
VKEVTLVTGGVRSGKSQMALTLATGRGRRVFLATAEPLDEEMRKRIKKHQEDRGASFLTVEEPIHLADALDNLPADVDLVLIDCLTVWIGNLLHRKGAGEGDLPEIDAFLTRLADPPCDLIIVTNEVGMGIVPANELARRFRDLAGWLNQKVAGIGTRVIFMVSGIPTVIKGELP